VVCVASRDDARQVYADRGYDHDTRYERRADTHQTMISLACSTICLRNLRPLR
jgi:hypothetical protein